MARCDRDAQARDKPYFEENLFCDIKIIVRVLDGSEVVMHGRATHLALSSEYFHGLFKSNMEETFRNGITIEGFSPLLVKEMLRFMYYSVVDNLYEICRDLIYLAFKYELVRLKIECLYFMHHSLSIDNVLSSLKVVHDLGPSHYKADIIFLDALKILIE